MTSLELHPLAVSIFSLTALSTSFAAVAPYGAPDANTVQLWHLNEAAGSTQTVVLGNLAGSGYSVDLNPASATPPTVTNVLGASSFAGFGNAASFPAVDLAIGYDANNSGAFQGDASGTVLSADRITLGALGINGSQPFTLEAMVNLTSAAGNREIIATDSSATGRGFQFRLTTGGTTGQRLEFNLIGSAGSQRFADLPNTGDHAFALNDWFHAAFTFDGTNAQFYWTQVENVFTAANPIGGAQALTIGAVSTIEGPLILGNENRNIAGEALFGSLDEVRISNSARSASQFIFQVPEPASVGLLALGALALAGRRRRQGI